MNTAVINIKVEPSTKKKAQKVARDMGVSLSSLLNAHLKEIIKTKRVKLNANEEPSEYLIKSIKQSEKDAKKGKVSPRFSDVEEAIKWLDDPKAKYQNGDRV